MRWLCIDIGSELLKASVFDSSSSDSVTLFQEACTPCAVGFQGKKKILGEEANLASSGVVRNVFGVVGASAAQKSHEHWAAINFVKLAGESSVELDYDEAAKTFSFPELAAIILADLVKAAKADSIMIATSPENNVQSLVDACKIAGIQVAAVVSTSAALSQWWLHRNASHLNENERVVAFVDCGAFSTTTTISSFSKSSARVLGRAVQPFGAAVVDGILLNHFLGQIRSSIGESAITSKLRTKLLRSCSEIKKQLTNVEDACLQLEIGESDFTLKLSRDALEDLIASVLHSVADSILSSFELAGRPNIDSIELLGGGTNIVAVKEKIESTFHSLGVKVPLFRSLDFSSISMGLGQLALHANGGELPVVLENYRIAPEGAELSEHQIEAFRETHALVEANHDAVVLMETARNELESQIYEFREEKVLKTEQVELLLTETEDFLYSDHTAAEFKEKRASLVAAIEKLVPEYLETKEREKRERAQKEEREEAIAAAAAAAAPKEDHDFRKLPFTERFRMAERCKNEGNAFWKEKKAAEAVERYTKAIVHCGKFFDLSPDQKQQVSGLELSCCLNLALVKFNQNDFTDCERQCTRALSIDGNAIKALYRRAQAREKLGKIEDAINDSQAALKIENDKDVAALLDRLKARRAQEEDKSKKVFSKMFS